MLTYLALAAPGNPFASAWLVVGLSDGHGIVTGDTPSELDPETLVRAVDPGLDPLLGVNNWRSMTKPVRRSRVGVLDTIWHRYLAPA